MEGNPEKADSFSRGNTVYVFESSSPKREVAGIKSTQETSKSPKKFDEDYCNELFPELVDTSMWNKSKCIQLEKITLFTCPSSFLSIGKFISERNCVNPPVRRIFTLIILLYIHIYSILKPVIQLRSYHPLHIQNWPLMLQHRYSKNSFDASFTFQALWCICFWKQLTNKKGCRDPSVYSWKNLLYSLVHPHFC